ncbi:pyridoxal-phosphate dependent enzyme [Amycolatopsis anabasis]|uniref:pyridoxal-phosphate dependent enzyme n=1 Tax=Amycolatopsis anabasis TaxID=1840409 RepID=UPI00131A9064|nr:pyridoxal-phosphate dependent enzyme [Amycolatopsis anabasis]
MRVISTPQEFNVSDLYVDLRALAGHRLYLKCEGFNFAGSIKLKAAVEIVTAAERAGALRPGATLVESSSGNIGVALSLVAASRGYRFVCVTDTRCTLLARQLMQNYGAEVHVVTEPRPGDGLLGARLRLVRRLCAEHADYVWLDQYTNPGNWAAHYRTTGPEILRTFPELDVLFVGMGTTGTLTGCARYLRQARPSARIVAVDGVGPAIPGLCESVRPPVLDGSVVDDVVHVEGADAIRACHRLVRHGFLFGASTGTVLSGALTWLARNAGPGDRTAVAIAPDLGDRYLDTVYQDQWVADAFGPVLDSDDSLTADTLSEVP